ncbi:hypothetical protein MAR_003355 [Mya arenaria]|uniref:Uncharacterized protein n=2 Tax=Mya arenaria TaxID=6604 RepID=A0ABY7G8V8_MYAAR|nr:hypothetical protein MAR_003355 [Mya arenaria]
MTTCMPVLTELCRLLLEIGVNVLGLGNLAVHTLAIPMEVIARFAYDRPLVFTGICIAVLLLWQFGGAIVAFLQSASAATVVSNPEIASALTTDIAIPAFTMAIGALR